MKINKVTITGADDKTNPSDLINLSIKYPFVEWAILFSNSRQGQERYPSEDWKMKFDTLVRLIPGSDRQVAAHFCGWYSSEVLENSNIDLLKNLSSIFKRVQINYNFKRSKNWNLTSVLEYAKENPDRSIIFQYKLTNINDGGTGFSSGKNNPSYKHGLYFTKEYGIYANIKRWCFNKNDPNYIGDKVSMYYKWIKDVT